MKKILIILNESHFSNHVILSALEIAKQSNSLLQAVFLNDTTDSNSGYLFPNDLNATGDEQFSAKDQAEEVTKLMKDEIKAFHEQCKALNIELKIEIDKAVSIKHLVELSCYSDLIIADSASESDEYSLKDILEEAFCPVLLVSKDAKPVKKIFLAFDGSPSSIYAIKMFSYIFPEYKDLPTKLFHITKDENGEIPHLNEIKGWASKHFSNFSFELITGEVKKDLVENIRQDPDKIILVMGAYGGLSFFRLFSKSTSEIIISETNASIFIAHE